MSLLPRSDVGCKTVANMIKGKTPEEIRKLFNIVNDFTPEEEVRDACFQSDETADRLLLSTGSDQEGKRKLPSSSGEKSSHILTRHIR